MLIWEVSIIITVTTTELKYNFDNYLQMVQAGEEIIILRDGKEMARLISRDKSVSFLTDSLLGVLKNDYDDKDVRAERAAKYEI